MSEPEATKFGRRGGNTDADGKSPTEAAPVASRRRAADGSEIAGGRKDAPSGWGEGSTVADSAFAKRPPVAPKTSADIAGATKVAEEQEEEEGGGGASGAGGGEKVKVWTRHKFQSEGAEEVQVIRDSEGIVESEELETKVAEAPRNVAGRKIQTLRELAVAGGELNVSQSRLAGIDLSLLTVLLAPPDALTEPDQPWEFERMLQEISQAMTLEEEKQAAEDAAPAAAT